MKTLILLASGALLIVMGCGKRSRSFPGDRAEGLQDDTVRPAAPPASSRAALPATHRAEETGVTAALSCDSSGILGRIESYEAPPYPDDASSDRETYDHRVQDNMPVPASLTDALVFDIWERVRRNTRAVVPPSEQEVAIGIGVYVEQEWGSIAGFRPWTHWNFIRSLTADEKRKLAKEVASHIRKHGVPDPTAPPDIMDCALVLDRQEVKPGDDVHYTITIKGAKDSKRLCVSHIRSHPWRWVYESKVGSRSCSIPYNPTTGSHYEREPRFALLTEGSTITVSGMFRILEEGDYEISVHLPHWYDGCGYVGMDTWPLGEMNCWLGLITSKPVPLRISSPASSAEPSRATDAAAE